MRPVAAEAVNLISFADTVTTTSLRLRYGLGNANCVFPASLQITPTLSHLERSRFSAKRRICGVEGPKYDCDAMVWKGILTRLPAGLPVRIP
jgi:hypothetical protein